MVGREIEEGWETQIPSLWPSCLFFSSLAFFARWLPSPRHPCSRPAGLHALSIPESCALVLTR